MRILEHWRRRSVSSSPPAGAELTLPGAAWSVDAVLDRAPVVEWQTHGT
jgi:hypothetical protein